jgi:dienelactone hydrolase
MANTTEIGGVTFYNNAPICISQYKQECWLKKALSLIQSFGFFIAHAARFLYLRCTFKKVEMQPYTNPEQLTKKRLVVCLHGLNSHPVQFKILLDSLKKGNISSTDVYIPYVYKRGNAKLDELVKPIFEQIKKWNGEELVLVGISNGGRIARALKAEILKADSGVNVKKIKFVSIVGACQGSSLVNLAKKIKLSCCMSSSISDEMAIDPERNKQLNKDWEESFKNSPSVEKECTFFAAPHDWMVPNYSSTLLEVPHKSTRYAIVKGHGHNSIVQAVTNAAAKIILD